MNLMELFVKIGVDDQASSKVANISQKIGSGLKTAAKIGVAAISAVSAGVVALGKASIDAYADYEQLVGGIETLFGTGGKNIVDYAESVGKSVGEVSKEFVALSKSQATVLKNADNAYKTAGLSANAYMETVTSFSASLLQSLDGDTVAAAQYADQAITDMSDNANKMGTDMEMIQNAYQGFAKANYTMLDNLKLGYGGTKEEMERLIADANAVKSANGEMATLTISSFADVTEAIHIIQTEMGITGTTALEASTTITGSVNSMKAAWTNLVVGIADENQNFDTLVTNFVNSASTVFSNLMPRIQTALNGIGSLIEGLAPTIIDAIPVLISDVLPSVIKGAVNIVETLVQSFADNSDTIAESAVEMVVVIADGILNMLPTIVELGLDLLVALAEGIAEYMPQLIPTVIDVVLKIVEILTEPSTLDNLLTAALSIIKTLAQDLSEAIPELIPTIVEVVLSIIEMLTEPDLLSQLIDASIAIVIALADGLIESLPELLDRAPTIVQNLLDAVIENAPKLLSAAGELIGKLVSGIGENLGDIADSAGEIVASLGNGIIALAEQAREWGKDMLDNFISGIKDKVSEVTDAVSGVAQDVKDFLGFSEPEKGPLSNFHTYAPDMIDLFVKGIRDNEHKITDQIEKSFDFGEKTISAVYDVTEAKSYGESGDANGAFLSSGGKVSIVQNIYSKAQTAADLMQEAQWEAEMAVLMGV